MSQANQPRGVSAALGLAGVMGCFMAAFALASLAVGLGLDQLLQAERRIATLVCVLGGMPLNLVLAMWITRRLIARIVPVTAPPVGAPPPADQAQESSGERPDESRTAS